VKNKVRALLADDHKLVRQGFRLILLSQPDMEVVGETGNGREAVELAKTLKPDVVLMDVTMPELIGIEATRRIREPSVYTVDGHRTRIMDRLNLYSVGELVRFAVRNGLVD
jgi:DNA-binding NarL/FixJ family response regulator